jgi:carbamoyl-phosphate synthase large subunit
MGIDEDFGRAYAKAQAASNNSIPTSGTIFVSVKDRDKHRTVELARRLVQLGFSLVATWGTARYLTEQGISVKGINKVAEGRPHVVDLIKNREVHFIINTVSGAQAQKDSFSIRRNALQFKIPYTTTISGARAVVNAMEMLVKNKLSIRSIQEYNRGIHY